MQLPHFEVWGICICIWICICIYLYFVGWSAAHCTCHRAFHPSCVKCNSIFPFFDAFHKISLLWRWGFKQLSLIFVKYQLGDLQGKRHNCYNSNTATRTGSQNSRNSTQRNSALFNATQRNSMQSNATKFNSAHLNPPHCHHHHHQQQHKWPGGEGHGDFIPAPSGHSPVPPTRKSPGGSSRISLTWEISLGLREIWLIFWDTYIIHLSTPFLRMSS